MPQNKRCVKAHCAGTGRHAKHGCDRCRSKLANQLYAPARSTASALSAPRSSGTPWVLNTPAHAAGGRDDKVFGLRHCRAIPPPVDVPTLPLAPATDLVHHQPHPLLWIQCANGMPHTRGLVGQFIRIANAYMVRVLASRRWASAPDINSATPSASLFNYSSRCMAARSRPRR